MLRTTITAASIVAMTSLFLAPPAARAQGSGISGLVRDTTGGVIPGVTVEAASPSLIEKVRTTVTDEVGRYNIVDLRPGTYTVTFTLPGFATLRREAIELTSGFTATVNAEMIVGAVGETVTVTGATPVVDTQSVRTQQVMKTEVLESLPSGMRDPAAFASLTLGATASTAGRNDVGGNQGENNTGLGMHGSRGDDGRLSYDGMNANNFYGGGGGQQRSWRFNMVAVQEVVVDTGGNSAEIETGGANMNLIPREGGNRFTFHSIVNYTNEHLSSGKVSDALIARGSAEDSNSLKKVYDYGYGVGGPIARDRLWFFAANRFWGAQAYAANNYFNQSSNPFVYEPDLSRPAYGDRWTADAGVRFTWQASAKHKFNASVNGQRSCGCWGQISAGARTSPEAGFSSEYGKGHGNWLTQASWTYPATNRWLFQGTVSFIDAEVRFDNSRIPGPDDVAITELTTGYTWGALPGAILGGSYEVPHHTDNYSQQAAVSYVSGSHVFKTGMQSLQGQHDIAGDARPNGVNYIFDGGQPRTIRQFASPFANHVRVRRLGWYAQDQWTIHRMTLNLGVRYDHGWAYAKPITLPAGPFIGERSYPEARDIPNFHDITPRLGAAYDLFGNGRTAVKVSWGRYLAGLGGGDATNVSPAVTVFPSTDRIWSDANGNFIPDCDLKNLSGNGECGTVNNLAFGEARPTTRWADAARTGWGVREYSYQYSLGVQHELRPGFGLTVAYYHTDWNNQQAVINNALGVGDFTPYCIAAPADTRLAEFGGRQICGLYDESPAKFGQRNAERVRWQDIPGAGDGPNEVFNGVDIGLNGRFGRGGMVLGGVTFGRSTFDYCWQNTLPNVTQIGTPGATDAVPYGTLPRSDEYCRIQPDLWDGIGSQIKVQATYPMPYDFVVSAAYKHLPGISTSAVYNLSNSEALPTLGRDLSACRGTTGAACTARVPVDLLPSVGPGAFSGATAARLYDERINQIDLRFSRVFAFGQLRLQGVAELYNLLNIRPAQAINTTYGPSWLLPSAILGGRLFKFGAQIDY